jgi:hypothetical protein
MGRGELSEAMMKTTYLSCADTAKLIRAQLKRRFPGVKFSVRSSTYSMGASIDISWTDGPTTTLVDAVVKPFAGSGFDGMIDLKYGKSHWLLPDGSSAIASCDGTEGSRGSVPSTREWMPHPDAKLVHFGADHVFTSRSMSPAFAERMLAAAKRRHAMFANVEVDVSKLGVWFKCPDWDTEREMRRLSSRFMAARAAI